MIKWNFSFIKQLCETKSTWHYTYKNNPNRLIYTTVKYIFVITEPYLTFQQ